MRLKVKIAIAAAVVVGVILYLADFYPEAGPRPDPSSPTAPSSSLAAGEDEGDGIDDPARPREGVDSRAESQELIPHHLRGKVLDSITDQPVAGAEVRVLESFNFWLPPRLLALAVTDAHGSYRFPRLNGARSHLVLRVERSGYVPHESDRNKWRRELPSERVIYLSRGTLVTGQVIREDGTPVSGGIGFQLASLHASASSQSPQGLAQARYTCRERIPFQIDSEGRFETATRGERLAIEVYGDDFAPGFSEVISPRKGEPNHVVIRVDPGVALRGRVRDDEGNPVASATVICLPAIRDRYPDHLFYNHYLRLTAVTSDDGAFVIPNLTDQYRGIQVKHEGYTPHAEYNTLEESAEPVEITLRRAQWLTGTVVLPAAMKADPPELSGALLVGRKTHDIPIDPAGQFRSPTLPVEVARATLQVDGFVPRALEWQPGPGACDVGLIPLDPGHGLQVQVVDDTGAPIEACAVLISVPVPDSNRFRRVDWKETDDSGVATLAGVAGDMITVAVQKSGYTPWSESRAVDAADSPLSVQLLRQGSLSGTVTHPDGSALGGATISVPYPGAKPRYRYTGPTESLADGRFHLRGVHRGTPLTLVVSARHLASHSLELSPLTAAEQRDVGSVALGAGREIRGRVVDERGHPAEGAVVSAQKVENSFRSGWSFDPWTESDASGEFRIPGLAAGSYSVSCKLSGANSGWQQVDLTEVESASIEIRLERGELYSAVVVDEDGHPVSEALVSISSKTRYGGFARTDAAGRFTHNDVPEGKLTISVRHGDYQTLELSVLSPDQLPAELVVSSGAHLDVHVRVVGDRRLPEYLRVQLSAPRLSSSFSRAHAGGVIRLTGLHEGEIQVQLLADGFPLAVPATAHLEKGRLQEVEVTLDGSMPPVTIHVVDVRGNPIAGARIRFQSAHGRGIFFGHGDTDAKGVFRSHHPRSGGVTMTVLAAGYVTRSIAHVPRQSLADERIVRLQSSER